MLFNQKYSNRRNNRFTVRPIVVVQNARLPWHLTKLNVLCHGDNGRNHPLPVLTQFRGTATSHKGQMAAKYVCPLCSAAQHFVEDPITRKTFCLWKEAGQ